jgi:hypothetical protein
VGNGPLASNAFSRVALTSRGEYEEERPQAADPGTENESQEEGPSRL